MAATLPFDLLVGRSASCVLMRPWLTALILDFLIKATHQVGEGADIVVPVARDRCEGGAAGFQLFFKPCVPLVEWLMESGCSAFWISHFLNESMFDGGSKLSVHDGNIEPERLR